MKCKYIRLIMELIFIFILPLVFMCFTSQIQVERNFEYDNNGNYETSQDVKQLSFDNSIIKFIHDDTYINFLNYNQLFGFNHRDVEYDDVSINFSNYDYIVISGQNTLSTHATWLSYTSIYTINNIYWLSIEGSNKVYAYCGDYSNRTNSSIQFTLTDNLIDNDILYTGIYIPEDTLYNELINIYLINLTEMFGSGYEPIDFDPNDYNINLSDYKEPQNINIIFESDSIICSNSKINYTIWGNIKQIIIDYLDVNDNVLLDLLLCYLFLWFFHFLIWHTFYRFFDWIFHLNLAWGKDNE